MPRCAAVVVVWLLLASGGAAAQTSIKIDKPRVTGAYDTLILQRYLRREQNKYIYCYERQAARSKTTLARKLTVRFTVEPDGRTSAVRVEGIADEIENCVAAMVRRLRLPRIDKVDAAVSVVTTTLTFTRPPGRIQPQVAPMH